MSTLENIPLMDRFIIRYAGAAVSFNSGACELVADPRADRFPTEADAWNEARQQGLDLNRVTVEAVAAAAKK